MSRLRVVLALFAAFALLAAACSSDGGGEDQAEEQQEDEGQEEAEAPAPGGVVDENTDFVFCDPEQDPDVEPVSVDEVGVTDDAIKLGAIVLDLTELPGDFAVDLGPWSNYYEVFVDYINEECGGINGRMLDLTFYEIGPLDLDERRAACIQATEDDGNFIVNNPNGFQGDAVTCISDTNETLFLTTQGQATEQYDASDSRLWTAGLSFSQGLEAMVLDLDDRGLLDGETIGVVYPDTPGQPEAVESSVVDLLDELGHDVAVAREVPCNNSPVCTDGIPLIVEEMVSTGVTVVLPALNVISTGPLVQEAAIQGLEPTWYQSEFNSMSGEVTNSRVVAAGPEAAENYDGTEIIGTGTGALYRDFPDQPPTSSRICNEIYQEAGGEAWDYADPDENGTFGATASVCHQLRIIYQVLTGAGPELTQDAVIEAWEQLDDVVLGFTSGSYGPGKYSAPDNIHTLVLNLCEDGTRATPDSPAVCITALDEYRPIPSR